MNTSTQYSSLCTFATIGFIAIATGCQSFAPSKFAGVSPQAEAVEEKTSEAIIPKVSMPKVSKLWADDEQAQVVAPDRVVGTWSEAVLHQNGKGTRGFGGRLYFYDRSSADPVRVNGQLVVYAFEEDNRTATDHQPSKRYVFPPEQFAKHESDSEIGTSYSVWLPWDAAGGQQTEVSLIARFEPSQGGGLVVSDQTRHRLPGTPRPESMLATNSPRARMQNRAAQNQVVQTSSHGSAASPPSQAHFQQPAAVTPAKMTATTISLPSNFHGFGNRQASGSRQLTSPAARVATLPTASPAQASQPVAPHAGNTQTQSPTPTPFGTSVKYFTPGESARRAAQ